MSNHSHIAFRSVFWRVLEVGLDHLACLRFEDFGNIVKHDTVGGGVAFLDAQGATVDLDTLALIVFGSDAECVFSGDDAIVVFPCSLLAFRRNGRTRTDTCSSRCENRRGRHPLRGLRFPFRQSGSAWWLCLWGRRFLSTLRRRQVRRRSRLWSRFRIYPMKVKP